MSSTQAQTAPSRRRKTHAGQPLGFTDTATDPPTAASDPDRLLAATVLHWVMRDIKPAISRNAHTRRQVQRHRASAIEFVTSDDCLLWLEMAAPGT